MDTLEKLGFFGVGSMSRAYSYKWRLAKDWEQPTKRAIMAIIMQCNKALLIKAKSGTTSQGLNDHRG